MKLRYALALLAIASLPALTKLGKLILKPDFGTLLGIPYTRECFAFR
jgi:hypothetical protein